MAIQPNSIRASCDLLLVAGVAALMGGVLTIAAATATGGGESIPNIILAAPSAYRADAPWPREAPIRRCQPIDAGSVTNFPSATVADAAFGQAKTHEAMRFVGALTDDRSGPISRSAVVGDPREYLESTAVALRNRSQGPFASRLPLPQAVKDPYP
jgi:hypothetical protein